MSATANKSTTTKSTGPDPAAARAFGDYLVAQAKQIESERADLMERIGENRTQLRSLDKLGVLSDEQGDWLDKFYPLKEEGVQRSKDEIEATRKVRLAARKEVKGS